MRTLVILLCVICLGCSKTNTIDINAINGYWEIEEVTLSNGAIKQYNFNETIDYIKINDSLKGFRKKLKPSFNDAYFTSANAENLVLKTENDSVNLYYSTPFAQWKETILEATNERLMLVNENNDVYLYKRYTPIKLDIE